MDPQMDPITIGVISLVSEETIHKNLIPILKTRKTEPKFVHLTPGDLNVYSPPHDFHAVILIHPIHEGRLSLTDVPDARYTQLLPTLNNYYGSEGVCVIVYAINSLNESTEETHLTILKTDQHSVFSLSSFVILCGKLEHLHKSNIDQINEFMETNWARIRKPHLHDGEVFHDVSSDSFPKEGGKQESSRERHSREKQGIPQETDTSHVHHAPTVQSRDVEPKEVSHTSTLKSGCEPATRDTEYLMQQDEKPDYKRIIEHMEEDIRERYRRIEGFRAKINQLKQEKERITHAYDVGHASEVQAREDRQEGRKVERRSEGEPSRNCTEHPMSTGAMCSDPLNQYSNFNEEDRDHYVDSTRKQQQRKSIGHEVGLPDSYYELKVKHLLECLKDIDKKLDEIRTKIEPVA